jgi:hypothetical protein
MQSQESMFEQSEPTPVQAINTDPREQPQRHDVLSIEIAEEAYQEYSEGYSGEAYSEGYHEPYAEPWQLEGEKLRPRQRPATALVSGSRMRSSVRPLAVLLLIVALIIGWSGLSHSRFDGPRHESAYGHFHDQQGAIPVAQTFFVQGAPTIVVNGGGGSVHIHAGDTNQVLISTRDGSPVQTTQNGNIIDIGTDSSFDSFGDNEQNLDITVPTASDLQIQSGSGDIQIEGVNGQMTLTTDSGDVQLQHTLLQGDSSIQTDEGDITVQGNIDPQGNYQFQTNSGDVKLTLPEDSSFHFVPSTALGNIENGFEGTQDNNSPGPLLKITTASGDISVQSQDD